MLLRFSSGNAKRLRGGFLGGGGGFLGGGLSLFCFYILSKSILSSFTRSTSCYSFPLVNFYMASSADNTFDLNMIDPNLLYRSIISTPPLKSFKKSCLISAFICKICPYNWGSAPYTSSISVSISSLILRERNTYSLSSSRL